MWLKAPSVAASGSKTYYLFYGNPSATDVSNVANTFIRQISNLQYSGSMNENTGTTVNDGSGNNISGTLTGVPAWGNGICDGSALDFDGAADYVTCDTSTALDFGTGDFSVSCWVNGANLAVAGDNAFVDKYVSDSDFGWMLKERNGGVALLTVDLINSWDQTFGTILVDDGLWHHVVATRSSGGNKIIYIDNVIDLNYVIVPRNVSSTRNLEYGRAQTYSAYLEGIVDEVYVYNKVLNAAEIADLSSEYAYATSALANTTLIRKCASAEPSFSIAPEIILSSILVSNAQICAGDSAQLIVTVDTVGGLVPPYTYSWTPTTDLSCSTCDTVWASPSATTTYQVLVTDSSGLQDSTLVTVTLVAPPTGSVGGNTAVCFGDSSQLIASGGTSYSWSPGATLSDSTIADPWATPTATTMYIATITNLCGSDVDTVTVAIQGSIPDAGVDTGLCVGGSVDLTASGGVSYVWSPNQDLSCTNCITTTASPATDMVYTVTVTDSIGCVTMDSLLVEVNGGAVMVESSKSFLCFAGDTTTLSVVGGCTGGDTQVGFGTLSSVTYGPFFGSRADVHHQFLYTATELIAAGLTPGGINTVAFNVLVKGSTGQFENFRLSMANTTTACMVAGNGWDATTLGYGPTNYTTSVGWNTFTLSSPFVWDGTSNIVIETCYNNPDGLPPGGDDQIEYASGFACDATMRYYTNINGSDGCALAPSFDYPNRANVRFGCTGTSALDSNVTYAWTPGASLSDSTSGNPVATVTSTISYSVIVNDNGCLDTDTITLTIDSLTSVVAGVTNDTSLCRNDSIQLVATGGTSYTWIPGTGLSDSTIANPMATPLTSLTYAVIVSDGCKSDSDTVAINVSGPTANAGPDLSFCFGGSVQATATGGVTYLWAPNSFLSCTACDKTTATPTGDMDYYVTVTDSFGCTDIDSMKVDVNGGPVSATSSPSTLCTLSDTVQLNVSGSIDISDDFDPGIDGSVWGPITGGSASTSCGSVSGNALYFDGVVRNAETIDLNVSGGGTIDFQLKLGSGGAPCETLDAGDLVSLEYSTNGGGAWTIITTYPNIGFTVFTPVSETIPAGAQTPSTRFRWNQAFFSGAAFDNWAIDDMFINTVGDSLDSTAIVLWSPGATLDDSTILAPQGVPGGQITYVVNVDDQGCFTSDTITIFVDTTVITVTVDTGLCLGNSTFIGVASNTSIASYLWSPAAGLSSTTVQSPLASPTVTTTYTVDVINTAGCAFTDSVLVTIDTLPIVGFTSLTSDLTVLFTNSSVNATSYSWDFGDGFFASVANPTHTYSANGTYNVCLTVTNYCGSDALCDSVTVVLVGCIPTVAAFDTATVVLTAVFTDQSNDATSWTWDFGDGVISTVQNPVHTYVTPGVYNVCLIATNACSTDNTCTSVTITTSAPCLPTLANFTSNAIGLDVVFTDVSTNATVWAWDFGDGNSSTLQNPIYSYSADGTYNACLVTTNACGSDTTCMNITVSAGACPTTTASYTVAATGLSLAFTDASTDPTGWSWDFGDGFTSTLQNPIHVYSAPGAYLVCLFVTN
ncbi:MAG: DUF2341 domain-containing protein, partial [Flavobacteriales bacterium]|nr:DUF2341 domain-containing protein [Flavobacteriales bacterium]